MQDPRTQGRTIGLYHSSVEEIERADGTVRYVESLTPAPGKPAGWSDQAPESNPLPRRETRITRSRKGRSSYRGTSAHPVAAAPVGAIDALPLVTCHEPNHVRACRCALTRATFSEATLLADAERWVAEHDPDGEPLPKVLGFATTRPEMLPGDRSTPGQSTAADDFYVAPETVAYRRLRRVLGDAPMMSASGRYKRSQGRRTFTRTWVDIPDDAPSLRPVALCAVSHDDMASALGIDAQSFLGWYSTSPGRANDTNIADAYRRRTIIARRGRLGPVARKHADVAVLAETVDAKGRKRQLLGRRMADRVELVTFADTGYWLGHRFVPDGATAAKRDVERTAQAATNVVAASRAEPAPNVSPLRQALNAIDAMRPGDRIGDVTCDAPGRYSRNGITCQTPAIAARHAMRTLAN